MTKQGFWLESTPKFVFGAVRKVIAPPLTLSGEVVVGAGCSNAFFISEITVNPTNTTTIPKINENVK
jgi:hypothetical protein